MKKSVLIVFFVFIAAAGKAQSFELSVQANGGSSAYVGEGTVSTTVLNAADPSNHTGYPNGDGNRQLFSYGADLQLQYIFRSQFILGLQTGYEVLGSKADINGVYDGSNGETAAAGYTEEHAGYVNINSYIGYRFKLNKVRLDVLPGLDLAFGAHESNTMDVTASDNTYYNAHTNNVYYHPSDDVRLRLGLAAYYRKFGITASYSHGLANFTADALSDAPVPAERRNVFRLGISYRIK